MNPNFKNAFFAILSIVIIVPLVLFISDYIYFQEPLSRVALYPDDPKCDKSCVEKVSDGYTCVEIKQDEFVCRLDRGRHNFSDNEVLYDSAGPISYGEIISFPEGKPDVQLFNIENMKIIDKNSKVIQVDFNDSQDIDINSNVIYTAQLTPGDDYVSCINPWKSTHLVRYMDLYEYENKTYAEFWGLHPFTPPELFPCDMPKIIETSLKINYDIPLPEYEEFGFVIEDESISGSESNEIDSGKINPEKQIPTFFEVMLMEQDIEWIMPQREWNNPDFEIVPPARICSEILYPNGTNVFLSTVFQTHYTLSNMTFHNSLPEDCVNVLPVTEYGRK